MATNPRLSVENTAILAILTGLAKVIVRDGGLRPDVAALPFEAALQTLEDQQVDERVSALRQALEVAVASILADQSASKPHQEKP